MTERFLGYVIGVDPGTSTGVFALRLDADGVRPIHRYQGGPDPALDWIEKVLTHAAAHGETVHVACERYTVGPKTGLLTQQPVALHVIGRLKHLTGTFDVPLTMQSPGDAKKFAPNELLETLGFRVKPAEVGRRDANDVNDAARHAVLVLAKTWATLFDALVRRTSSPR